MTDAKSLERRNKMQKRIQLFMTRVLPNGILDSFSVFCTKDKAEIIRQKYKGMGYSVSG